MKKSILALSAFLLLSVSLRAQDKPLPPAREFKPETRQAADVLPALQLPEYVITGSDLISFTEDRKDALVHPDSEGFTARAGRGTREQRFFDTAPTRMPLEKAVLSGSAEVFRLKAGAGTWATPHIQAWYADRYAQGDLASHVLYESSEGHVPRSEYTRFAFDVAGGTYLPRDLTPLLASSRLQGSFHANMHRYGLYADKLEQAVPPLDFRRDLLSLDWKGDLISRGNRVLDHALTLSFGHTGIDEQLAVLDTLDIDEYSGMENRFGLDGEARFDLGGYAVTGDLSIHVNDLSESFAGFARPFYMLTGARTRHDLNDNTWLEGGARVYLFRGSDQATQFRLYPTIVVRHAMGDDWTLHGGYLPVVHEQTLATLLRKNPYLMLASSIRHTDIPLRFEAGASYDNRSATSARIAASWSASPSYARFSLLPDPVRQQWELLYGGTSSILELTGDLAHAFTQRTRLQGSTVFRVSHNDVVDGAVPYLPAYEVRLLLQHDFPFDVSLQSTVQLAGDRDNSEGTTLPAWLLLGFELEYRVLQNVALFLRCDNVLDQSYEAWDDYRERPFFMMGGVVIRL
jgi:hypothetical protein